MNILPKLTAPADLRETGDGPRKKSLEWETGDPVQVGRVRMIHRTLVGQKVELEASNASCGIWWRTTLDLLPVKVP